MFRRGFEKKTGAWRNCRFESRRPYNERKIVFIWFRVARRGAMFRRAFSGKTMSALRNKTTISQSKILVETLFKGIVVGHDYAKNQLGIGSGFRTRIAELRANGLPILSRRIVVVNPFTWSVSRPNEYYLDPEYIAKIKAEQQANK
jgi:hypothetical protein